MKERVSFTHEFLPRALTFFEAPTEYEEASKQKNWTPETPEQLKKLRDAFALLNNPAKEDYELTYHKITATLPKEEARKLIHALRLATSGISTGPGAFDILYILGKEEVVKRIDTALEK